MGARERLRDSFLGGIGAGYCREAGDAAEKSSEEGGPMGGREKGVLPGTGDGVRRAMACMRNSTGVDGMLFRMQPRGGVVSAVSGRW